MDNGPWTMDNVGVGQPVHCPWSVVCRRFFLYLGPRSMPNSRRITLPRAQTSRRDLLEPLRRPSHLLKGIFRTKNLDDILAAAQEEGHKLKRTLGPINVTLLGIGAIIGAGIFATVGTAAAG